MTDCCDGFTADQLLATIDKYGPITAYEIAHLAKVSLRQALCAIHEAWWLVLPKEWDGPSWKYTRRPVISKTARMPKEIGEYSSIGSTPSGPRGYIVTG